MCRSALLVIAAGVILCWSAAANSTLAQDIPSESSWEFEVASVRPVVSSTAPDSFASIARLTPTAFSSRISPGGRVEIKGRLRDIIYFAYGLKLGQRVLGSEPILDAPFEILAVGGKDLPVPPRDGFGLYLQVGPFQLMTQALLASRFTLKTSWREETRRVRVLKLARQGVLGPGLQPLAGRCADRQGRRDSAGNIILGSLGCQLTQSTERIVGAFDRMSDLATLFTVISRESNEPFVDESNLEGGYEVSMTFSPSSLAPPGTSDSRPDLPSFTDAVREQLGLRIEAARRPFPMLVVESVSPLIEN